MDAVVLGLTMRIDLRAAFDPIPSVDGLEKTNVVDGEDCSMYSTSASGGK